MGKPPRSKETGKAVIYGAEKILSNLLRAVLQGFCEKYLGRYHRNFPVACPFFLKNLRKYTANEREIPPQRAGFSFQNVRLSLRQFIR